MNRLKAALGAALGACCICMAQVPEITPQVVGRAVQEDHVTVVYLAPRFATAIRMPDAINSVVLGDPDAFSAEHSEREPRIVVVIQSSSCRHRYNWAARSRRGRSCTTWCGPHRSNYRWRTSA